MEEMNAAMYLKRGIEYFEKGDYDRTIADVSEAIRLDPNNALAFGTRGAAFKAKKDVDRAIADLTEAIRLDPNNAPAYSNRGLAYVVKGDINQAISDLEMAVKIQPENDGFRQMLDKIKVEKSEWKKQLIIMAIGLFAGSLIGWLITLSNHSGSISIILIGAFLGIGIRRIGIAFVKEMVEFYWSVRSQIKKEYQESGFFEALKGFPLTVIFSGFLNFFIFMFKVLISPLAAIFDLIDAISKRK